MADEEIVIDIDEAGNVRVEGKNIQGPHCVQLTAGIESALGEVIAAERKPEFHRSVPVSRKVRG